MDPTLSINNLTSTDFQGMIRTNVQNEGYTPKPNWAGTFGRERPPPFGNQSTSVIHRFDRQRRLAQDDVERRKVEAMKAMRAKHDKARAMAANRGGKERKWSPMKDYENSNCALTQQFKSKLKLQPHERSSPSYTMGSKTSLATTSTGSLGPEYFVEEAFNMTSRARSPASYTFGMRNEKLKGKEADGNIGMSHSKWLEEGDKRGFTMSQRFPEPESRMVTPASNEYSLNFAGSQYPNCPGKSFGLKGHNFEDDSEGVLYSSQEAFEKSSRVETAPAYSFRPKFPQGGIGNPDPREMAEFHIGQPHESWDDGNQGRRGRTFGARLKDGKPALENSPPPGAYSPNFSESKYPGTVSPSFGMKLEPMALKDASVGPGEYETKSTLKKTGKSFGLKTKVTEPLTYGNGPASYTPSLNSSQFASSLPKSFGFHDANLRATRVGSPLSKGYTTSDGFKLNSR